MSAGDPPFCLIDTALGKIGLAWTDLGIVRLALPGPGIEARMARRGFAAEAPAELQPLLLRIVAYAEGEAVEFSDVAVDLSAVPEFRRQIYNDIRALGWGQTTTYGDIARRLGDVQLSRVVGQAMGANPVPLIIPCHRVLGADGKAGGFSAPGGVSAKMRMLALERAAGPTGQFSFGF